MSYRAAHPRAEAGRRAATRPLHHTYTRTRVHDRAHVSARSHTAARSAVAYAARKYTGCPVATGAYFSEENTEGHNVKRSCFDIPNNDVLYLSHKLVRGNDGFPMVELNFSRRAETTIKTRRLIFFSKNSNSGLNYPTAPCAKSQKCEETWSPIK